VNATPYRTAAGDLFAHGWWPLPLPPNAKTMPPSGFTGADGRTPTADDVIAHALDPRYGNVAIRLPKDIIGLDVDAYGDKHGDTTLAHLEAQLGALPPTVMVTSREDGVSGIRLYRLPPEVDEATLIGGLPGIETIRFGHRYAVAPPSIHPQTGKAYRWLTTLGMERGIPTPADLPELPAAWCDALAKTPANAPERPVAALAPAVNRGTCKVAPRWLSEALRGMELGASRHDVATRESLRAVRFEEMGHDIAREIDTFGLAFIRSISKDRDGGERTATAEWHSMLDGAREEVAATPTAGEKNCCSGQEYDPLTPFEVNAGDPLATPEDLADTSTWAPVDLTPHWDGTHTRPEAGILHREDGPGLLYPGRVHSFYGESESGKSWLAQITAAMILRSDTGTVTYIDFEADAGDIVERLRLLGISRDALHRLRYLRPETPRHHADPYWQALLNNPCDLIIIDGVTEALTMWGGETKDNDKITTWTRTFPRALARATGAAVVTIDHVPKDKETRGRFAIGGQAKLAAIDGAAYLIEPLEPLAPGRVGRLTVRVTKDRPGSVRAVAGMWRKADRTQEAAVAVLDATGEVLTFKIERPQSEEEMEQAKATSMRGQVIKALMEAHKPLSGNEVFTAIGHGRKIVLATIREMKDDGEIIEQARGALVLSDEVLAEMGRPLIPFTVAEGA
jgi:biotin operon repressor